MACGFQTDNSNGSLYVIDPSSGKTTRLKTSGGDGQYTVGTTSICLYGSETTKNALHQFYLGFGRISYDTHIWLGEKAGKNGPFRKFGYEIDPKQGSVPVIQIVSLSENRVLSDEPASLKPALGLTPIEKAYFVDTNGVSRSRTHVGHPVARLFEDPADLYAAAKKIYGTAEYGSPKMQGAAAFMQLVAAYYPETVAPKPTRTLRGLAAGVGSRLHALAKH